MRQVNYKPFPRAPVALRHVGTARAKPKQDPLITDSKHLCRFRNTEQDAAAFRYDTWAGETIFQKTRNEIQGIGLGRRRTRPRFSARRAVVNRQPGDPRPEMEKSWGVIAIYNPRGGGAL